MGRTGDGIDPLEVADGRKKFARPNIQEFLFFYRTEILCPWVKNCKEAVGRSCRMFWPLCSSRSDQ